MENIKVVCPDCGCDNIISEKQGTNKFQAIAGGVMLLIPNPIVKIVGGLVGLCSISDRGKIQCSCVNCGKTWFAGEYKASDSNKKTKDKTNQEKETPTEETDTSKVE